jgi:hypothetical protein
MDNPVQPHKSRPIEYRQPFYDFKLLVFQKPFTDCASMFFVKLVSLTGWRTVSPFIKNAFVHIGQPPI